MLEEYWRKFVDTKVAEEYYFAYSTQSGRMEWLFNALCMLATCSGLLAFFSKAPVLGAVITAAAQCVCALQPILPFGKRKETSGYVYKEYASLAAQAERTMHKVIRGEQSEDTLAAELDCIGVDADSIESKFSTVEVFPRNRRLHKRAEKAAMQYLAVHFDLEG